MTSALDVDQDRTGHGRGVAAHPGVLGAIAGIVGGAAFGAAMADLGALPSVASIVRADSPSVGLAVHMTIAALVGAGFGLLMANQRQDASDTLFWGLSYGAAWWFLGPLTLLPFLTGRPPAWDLAAAQRAVPSLFGHLLFGVVTALALAVLRRTGDRPRVAWRPAVTMGELSRGALAGAFAALGIALLVPDNLSPAAALGGTGWGRTLAVGVLVGVGFAFLSPHPPERGGPALVRGSAYGFLWWVMGTLTLVPLLSGDGLAWSLEATRERFPAFPGLILLASTAGVWFSWLGRAATALFSDDVRRAEGEGPGTRGLRAIGRGVLAGLAGGLVFTVLMIQIGYLPTVARLVGAGSPSAGLVVHLLISLVIGVSYALLFRGRSFDSGSALGWGVTYGFLWWVLGALTLLPLLLGGQPQWNVTAVVATFPSLVGHLAFGGALGLTYRRLETASGPWWISRTDGEAAQAFERRQLALGSAPAVWALVVLMAVTVPLIIA